MDTFGDPGWFHHQQIAQLWGLAALRLASSPIVGFNASGYTEKLKEYVESVSSDLLETTGGNVEEAQKRLNLKALRRAVKCLDKYAKHLDSEANNLKQNPTSRKCYLKIICLNRFRVSEIRKVNKAYLDFERSFIGKGLPGRPIYKHVIYAPGTWEGYAGLTLPSIREAVADQRWAEARDQAKEITKLLEKAASNSVL
jgi:N-acetylated-alpha-linked acidic dipeptidase